MGKQKIYNSVDEALSATDEFYRNQQGFSYQLDKVVSWLKLHVTLPRKGRVLDLCCGDGIWSRGMKEISPKLEFYGIDISEGGIEKAQELMDSDNNHFVVGNAETELVFPDDYFDLVFARGPGLYNQHDMDRPSTINVIETWHCKLKIKGVFYSIFASTPKNMGTYTPMDEVVLPYNRSPRKTDKVDFKGGKYHHTIESFHSPFWAASNVEIIKYSFVGNQHVLLTRLKD